jgi:heme-degrading monooxygenase HmoA
VLLTWTALELAAPLPSAPWLPGGARWAQAGPAGPGVAAVPERWGDWWTVVAAWDDEGAACAAAPVPGGDLRAAWHVVLHAVSYRGDAVLAGGARPFDALPHRGKVAGAAAVVTLAGFGEDPGRAAEFFERFAELGAGVRDAPGHRASLVQAPADGAVLTFSAWATLRDAVTWAYHRPDHSATVRRHEEHGLLATTGFLRCAVLASSGTLLGTDPLAGLTGAPVAHLEESA